jgi:hypothetical protein
VKPKRQQESESSELEILSVSRTRATHTNRNIPEVTVESPPIRRRPPLPLQPVMETEREDIDARGFRQSHHQALASRIGIRCGSSSRVMMGDIRSRSVGVYQPYDRSGYGSDSSDSAIRSGSPSSRIRLSKLITQRPLEIIRQRPAILDQVKQQAFLLHFE